MFPWRKRSEGFEWRTYVRTTVLARRAKRRQQVEDVKQAAVEHAREAVQRGGEVSKAGLEAGRRHGAEMLVRLGEAGRSGARAGASAVGTASTALVAAGRRSWTSGSSWAKEVGGPGLAAGWRSLWAATRAVWSAVSDWAAQAGAAMRPGFEPAGRGLSPAWAFLRRTEVETQLAIVGGGLLLAACARWASRGFDTPAWLAALAGIAALALSLGPRILAIAQSEARRLGWSRDTVARAIPSVHVHPRAVRGVLFALVAALLLGAGYWALTSTPANTRRAAPSGGNTLQGKAIALSGDLLRVGVRTVRLSGIEAPEQEQECQRLGGQGWRCGLAATLQLRRLVLRRDVSCELSGTDEAGHPLGVCTAGGRDIAGELVKRGHVFATPGLLSAYGSIEREAKAARAGLWSGGAERPSQYRAKRWEEAKRQAPDGCPIKGQLTSGGRVYVLPWSEEYDKIKLRLARGDRWFCSEDEARAAGWKRS